MVPVQQIWSPAALQVLGQWQHSTPQPAAIHVHDWARLSTLNSGLATASVPVHMPVLQQAANMITICIGIYLYAW